MFGYSIHGDGNDQEFQPGREGSSAGPLVVYGSSSDSEATPLLPGKSQSTISRYKSIVYGVPVLLVLVIVIGTLCMHFINCPLYPWTMNDIRRSWEKEVVQHEVLRGKWQLEKQEHTVIEAEWKLKKERHEKDVAHRIREEEERQERVRKEWAQESERHARDVEEFEKLVARMVREGQERQERARKEWNWEAQEHEKEVARRVREEQERQEMVRKEWEHEMQDHDRILEERRKREEGERLKLNMFWGGIEAHKCTTYATREYTAQLMNLPPTWEHRVEACKATPLEIHGTSYLPKSCEDKGPGAVMGRWEINQHEPDCASFWLWYKDKESILSPSLGAVTLRYHLSLQGCISPGSGRKRIEHYLENLPRGSDWREFCATTPAHFHGKEFPGAQECFQRNGGTYGHWEIEDVGCQ